MFNQVCEIGKFRGNFLKSHSCCFLYSICYSINLINDYIVVTRDLQVTNTFDISGKHQPQYKSRGLERRVMLSIFIIYIL